MATPSEIIANFLTAASIVLAARNSVHTWWTGIVGCAVFGWVFFDARLYADVLLQLFFIGASVGGWWNWLKGSRGEPVPVRWTPPRNLALAVAAGMVFAAAWAWGLARYTDAAAPLVDSTVLGLSIVAQCLMMGRRVENWIVWVAVNSLAAPLFWSRELHLTAFLYAFYWFNAVWAFFHWRRLARG